MVRAALLTLLLVVTALPAWAAESVLTLTPRPGAALRVLVDRSAAPVGSVVLMAGGDGVLDLDAQGNIGSSLRGNHLVHTRASYVKAGYAVFVPDIASTMGEVSRINVPVLLLRHRLDACRVTPPADADRFKALLTGAPNVDIVTLDGGGPRGATAEPYGAAHYHGFYGIDDQTVAATVQWLRANMRR